MRARDKNDHAVRVRDDIYQLLSRRKTLEGRLESVNLYIENILAAYATGQFGAITLTALFRNHLNSSSKGQGRAGQGRGRGKSLEPESRSLFDRLWKEAVHQSGTSPHWRSS